METTVLFSVEGTGDLVIVSSSMIKIIGGTT